MKGLVQWSDKEDEDNGYASLITVSSIQLDRVSVNMADSGNYDLRRRLEAQEQTFKTQQEALDSLAMIASLSITLPV